MRTRTCLSGLLGATMVGVLLAGRLQAEQKVPVRTAVLTAHDTAAIQATPVHWVRGRYYGFYRGGYGYYRPAYRYGYVYPRFYGYYRPRYYYPAATVYPYYSYYSPNVYPYAYPYTTVPMALTPNGHVLPAAVVATPSGGYYW